MKTKMKAMYYDLKSMNKEKQRQMKRSSKKRTYDELVTCKLQLDRAQAKFSAVSADLYQAVQKGEITEKQFQDDHYKVSFAAAGDRSQSLSFNMLEPLAKSWFHETGVNKNKSAEKASDLVSYIKKKRRKVPTNGGFRFSAVKEKE